MWIEHGKTATTTTEEGLGCYGAPIGPTLWAWLLRRLMLKAGLCGLVSMTAKYMCRLRVRFVIFLLILNIICY